MQMRNAARVLPEPVGAEMRVVLPVKILGQPCSCGSVGVPKRPMNQSRTSGCAHSKPVEVDGEVSMLIVQIIRQSILGRAGDEDSQGDAVMCANSLRDTRESEPQVQRRA